MGSQKSVINVCVFVWEVQTHTNVQTYNQSFNKHSYLENAYKPF